jgi:hypothetical protein
MAERVSGQTTVDPERVTDAEDAIQDAFVRLETTGGVDSPEGLLIRKERRLHLRAAPDQGRPDNIARPVTQSPRPFVLVIERQAIALVHP